MYYKCVYGNIKNKSLIFRDKLINSDNVFINNDTLLIIMITANI